MSAVLKRSGHRIYRSVDNDWWYEHESWGHMNWGVGGFKRKTSAYVYGSLRAHGDTIMMLMAVLAILSFSAAFVLRGLGH